MSADSMFMVETSSSPPTRHGVQRTHSFIVGIADNSGRKRGSLTFAGNISQLKRAGSSRASLDSRSEEHFSRSQTEIAPKKKPCCHQRSCSMN
eukprot:scaffold344_cov130-Cylindrotheca_fusiformis.AAC.7